jgi:hypothetical protein
MPAPDAPAPAADDQAREDHLVPISKERVRLCRDSAQFWVDELPRYASRRQHWADFWAILAGVLASVTSLSIWPVISDPVQAGTTDKVLVSAAALASAIAALIPRIINFAESAGQARELSSQYGAMLGSLIDICESPKAVDNEATRAVVDRFQSVKEKKDSLRGLPSRKRIAQLKKTWYPRH